ncbi:hypothetical protein C8Q74DRAFT_1369185 [Fomes fomentarius]|nr:hypothetical protein C8Q74DRAFT_1369185 [Fomes fomentarius]
MKSFSFLALLASAASLVAAQNAVIAQPPPGTHLSPGQSFVVEVDRPNSLSNSLEVSVAIGLISCKGIAPPGTCDGVDTSQRFGQILFAGPYSPQLAAGKGALVQNYTVTVPDGFQTGPAILSVAHFNLVGALFFPSLQVLNETVLIQ